VPIDVDACEEGVQDDACEQCVDVDPLEKHAR
jgi:hypothetical protein